MHPQPFSMDNRLKMRLFLISSAICIASCATAQEFNFGLHVNPILTTPFMDGASKVDKRINVSKARIGANIGLDANLVMGKWRLQTGAGLMHKSVSYYQRTNSYNVDAYAKDIVETISVEVPMLVGYKLATQNKETYYHVYGVAGVSYEWNTLNGTSSKTGIRGSSGSAQLQSYDIGYVGDKSQWMNIVAGVNINAILRGVGLIDYGFTFHLPMGNAAGYTIASDVNTGGGTVNYRGTYYPRMAHIDFKLCYYFLSLRDGGIKRYSKV